MTVPTQPTPATDAPPTPLPEVPEGTTTVQSPNLSVLKKRAISEVVPDPPLGAHGTMAAGGEVKDEEKGPAKKKPKMTEEEKEQKRKEKEAKENEREAKKTEREEKKRLKDEEKRKKDEEKRKKEEEKAKKDRKQLKLNNFFKTPSTPRKDHALSPFVTDGMSVGIVSAKFPRARTPVDSICDFDKEFKEFWVKPNVTMAHTIRKDDACRAVVNRALDEALALASRVNHEDTMDIDTTTGSETRGITKEQIVELLRIPPYKARCRRGDVLPYSTKDVLARINTPDDPGLPALIPTGSTKPEKLDSAYYLKILNSLPHKFLKFAEDVRPPYSGTYTRIPTSSGLLHGKNPFQRALPKVDYDYDSEAEWVADDEGEELLSEDEEDRESEAGESLDGFLDDEEDVALKRGGLGILVAMNSGICWEDEKGKNPRPDLEEMRVHVLLEGVSAPIDPFSTWYWMPQPAAGALKISHNLGALHSGSTTAASNGVIPTIGVASASNTNRDTSKRLVPPECMDDFKHAINGSDMTKTGLIEVLKKAFPKIPKENIKNTLDLVAKRVGEKRDDKRWILI